MQNSCAGLALGVACAGSCFAVLRSSDESSRVSAQRVINSGRSILDVQTLPAKRARWSQDAMADFCTIQPTFTIVDLEKAEEYMTECVEATMKEQGCLSRRPSGPQKSQ